MQELDLRHHLHPFTDHKELKVKKPKVVVRANGVFIFDNDGKKLISSVYIFIIIICKPKGQNNRP